MNSPLILMGLLIEKTERDLISSLVCRLHRTKNFDRIFHIFGFSFLLYCIK